MAGENKLQARLARGLVVFDGAMGTEIYRRHFFVNTSFENLVLTSPDTIRDIHRNYLAAGADVLTTDTFNANRNKLRAFGLADAAGAINRRAVELARECAGDDALIAGSVGPAGELPPGAPPEEAAAVLREAVEALAGAGADFIIFESLSGIADVERAVAAIAGTELPYLLSLVLDGGGRGIGDGRALDDFLAAAAAADRPPTAWGLNCGKGPDSTLGALEALAGRVDLPIVVQPNAGEPKRIDNRTMYMNSPEYFTTYAQRYATLGARGIGGCCGIGPEHIAEMASSLKSFVNSESRRLVEITAESEAAAMPEIPLADRSRFGAKLAAGEWVTSIEITPPPGFDLSGVVAKAKRCREVGVDAINIPDGPRASARISPLITALAIQRDAGIEAVMHCCARDRSLIGLQAELLGAAQAGIDNILFITGDPPKLGDYPSSSGVFDVDAVGLAEMQRRLNRGLEAGGRPLKMQTRCVIGVGLDPNAIDLEREYRRICAKAEAGADFIITQPVFSPEALIGFLRRIGHLGLPVIAGVWPLASLRNAEFMKNEVPGVIVPDRVMERMAAVVDKEAQRAVGIAIAREIAAEVASWVDGIQVSAPFGNVETAIAVLQK